MFRSKISFAFLSFLSLAGTIWLVNLPYPMIRRPVARIAPILLLPSYLDMDRNYKSAIANVEGSEQLIDRATSKADIELGGKKSQQAQKNLDALPVWFLGYEPKGYCSLFGCSWRFTFDEFQLARTRIGRMEAKVFQEKNAIVQLEQIEAKIKLAKQNYQENNNLKAINNWQQGIDELKEISESTFAGTIAVTKLSALERDFQQTSGLVAGNTQTNITIAAAKQFASKATQHCQNPPHSVAKWETCIQLWQEAIERLERTNHNDPGYVELQSLLATYQNNLYQVKEKKQIESDSVNAYSTAQLQIQTLLANNAEDRNYLNSQIQGIIDRLENVQVGTTVYPRAQELLQGAEKKLAELKQT